MKRKILYSLFFLTLICSMLFYSKLALYYAGLGLTLWFQKMIPALLPFMILSGIIIRLQLTDTFVNFIYPFFYKLFHMSRSACYVFFVGFLCGFPMGAKTIEELYERGRLSLGESAVCLYFCNNIGPAYFCGFILPYFNKKQVLPYLFGMYGIPFLYGMVLHSTNYSNSNKNRNSNSNLNANASKKYSIYEAVDEAVHTSMESICVLGGYMILFNLLNLPLRIVFGKKSKYLSPILEISGGITLLDHKMPLLCFLALSFGGLCCIAQTFSCLKAKELQKLRLKYIFHKLMITLLTGIYYLGWYLLGGKSFLT